MIQPNPWMKADSNDRHQYLSVEHAIAIPKQRIDPVARRLARSAVETHSRIEITTEETWEQCKIGGCSVAFEPEERCRVLSMRCLPKHETEGRNGSLGVLVTRRASRGTKHESELAFELGKYNPAR